MNYRHTLIFKDTSGFTSNTITVYIVYRINKSYEKNGYNIYFIYLTGANKTEHFLTDGEEQHGPLKLLKKYLFCIFYDKALVKN